MTTPSRDQPITGVQFFDVLLHILGQICRFVLSKNAQQWAQLQPPALHRYTMPTITQQPVRTTAAICIENCSASSGTISSFQCSHAVSSVIRWASSPEKLLPVIPNGYLLRLILLQFQNKTKKSNLQAGCIMGEGIWTPI